MNGERPQLAAVSPDPRTSIRTILLALVAGFVFGAFVWPHILIAVSGD